MNSVAPGVPKRPHLLGLARDVVGFPVLNITTGGGPLEVGVELDAVWGIDVDALNLPAQAFALRQRRHHPHTVAEDHPVRPVGVVLVELRLGVPARQAVEIREQVELLLRRPVV